MGFFSRFHRIPPFFVGTLCGGGFYVYFHNQLKLKYHPLPESLWNIMYTVKPSTIQLPSTDEDQPLSTSTTELYDIALKRRKNREYYRDSFIVGWNDTIRSFNSFFIRNIFGEELK